MLITGSEDMVKGLVTSARSEPTHGPAACEDVRRKRTDRSSALQPRGIRDREMNHPTTGQCLQKERFVVAPWPAASSKQRAVSSKQGSNLRRLRSVAAAISRACQKGGPWRAPQGFRTLTNEPGRQMAGLLQACLQARMQAGRQAGSLGRQSLTRSTRLERAACRSKQAGSNTLQKHNGGVISRRW